MSDFNDHDLLITIANDCKWLKDTLVQHIKEDAANYTMLDSKINQTKDILGKTVDSAHKRIDWLMVSGVFAVVCLALSIFLTGVKS